MFGHGHEGLLLLAEWADMGQGTRPQGLLADRRRHSVGTGAAQGAPAWA